MSFLLSLILILGPALETCQDQTATTTPTWSQCLGNQVEHLTD